MMKHQNHQSGSPSTIPLPFTRNPKRLWCATYGSGMSSSLMLILLILASTTLSVSATGLAAGCDVVYSPPHSLDSVLSVYTEDLNGLEPCSPYCTILQGFVDKPFGTYRSSTFHDLFSNSSSKYVCPNAHTLTLSECPVYGNGHDLMYPFSIEFQRSLICHPCTYPSEDRSFSRSLPVQMFLDDLVGSPILNYTNRTTIKSAFIGRPYDAIYTLNDTRHAYHWPFYPAEPSTTRADSPGSPRRAAACRPQLACPGPASPTYPPPPGSERIGSAGTSAGDRDGWLPGFDAGSAAAEASGLSPFRAVS